MTRLSRGLLREVNETIRDVAKQLGLASDSGAVSFVCECAEGTCLAVVELTLDQYDARHGAPVLADGHVADDYPPSSAATVGSSARLGGLTSRHVH